MEKILGKLAKVESRSVVSQEALTPRFETMNVQEVTGLGEFTIKPQRNSLLASKKAQQQSIFDVKQPEVTGLDLEVQRNVNIPEFKVGDVSTKNLQFLQPQVKVSQQSVGTLNLLQSKQQVKQELAQVQDLVQVQQVKQMQEVRQIQQLKQNQVQRQNQRTMLEQIQLVETGQPRRPPPIVPVPKIPLFPVKQPPKPPVFFNFKVKPQSNKQGGLFNVQVRRQGVFKNIGRTATLSQALGLGSRRVENTLATTFRVRGYGTRGGMFALPKTQKRVKNQVLTFMEVPGARLNTRSELSELSLFKRKKRKKLFI